MKRRLKSVLLVVIISMMTMFQGNLIIKEYANDESILKRESLLGLKNAGPDWDAETQLPIHSYYDDVFVEDANNDGFKDIITANEGGDDVSIFTWNATKGGWNEEIIRPVGDGPYGVYVGDADNDGDNDIVTGNRYSDDVSILLWNDVTSNWGGPISKLVGTDPRKPCIGDVNNDGYNDIITPNYDSSDVSLLLWNESASDWDDAISKACGTYTTCASIGDVNNDGYNDFVAGNHLSQDISVFYYNELSDDWTKMVRNLVTPSTFPISLVIEDATNDGFNDIIFTAGDGISILIQDTIQTGLGAEVRCCIGYADWGIHVGDANNDGYNDLVATDSGDDRIAIALWNCSIGRWNSPIVKSVGNRPYSVFVEDINNDGYNDIACANSLEYYLSLFLWNVPPTIEINAPYSNEIFGTKAPRFDVRVKDASIDSMWYTLDGGINNKTFSSNTTIDQALWDGVGSGSIEIDFYINDTTGNVGSASVLVRKDEDLPIITIMQPTTGKEFDAHPPIFNITVDEPNLAATWYSLDGGLTNVSISSLYGVINENLWYNTPDGPVTITFYAKDIANNTGSATIDITKNILQCMKVNILDLICSMDSFNLTFSIENGTNNGIEDATINMWWNGIDVSIDVQDNGNGIYSISLAPITVATEEPPILLNMTISALGYEDQYFETYIAVDPNLLEKGEGGPGDNFPVTLIVIVSTISTVALIGVICIYFLRKRKLKD